MYHSERPLTSSTISWILCAYIILCCESLWIVYVPYISHQSYSSHFTWFLVLFSHTFFSVLFLLLLFVFCVLHVFHLLFQQRKKSFSFCVHKIPTLCIFIYWMRDRKINEQKTKKKVEILFILCRKLVRRWIEFDGMLLRAFNSIFRDGNKLLIETNRLINRKQFRRRRHVFWCRFHTFIIQYKAPASVSSSAKTL